MLKEFWQHGKGGKNYLKGDVANQKKYIPKDLDEEQYDEPNLASQNKDYQFPGGGRQAPDFQAMQIKTKQPKDILKVMSPQEWEIALLQQASDDRDVQDTKLVNNEALGLPQKLTTTVYGRGARGGQQPTRPRSAAGELAKPHQMGKDEVEELETWLNAKIANFDNKQAEGYSPEMPAQGDFSMTNMYRTMISKKAKVPEEDAPELKNIIEPDDSFKVHKPKLRINFDQPYRRGTHRDGVWK